MPFGVQTDWVREALPRPEILSYPLETNVIDSIVVNATGVLADTSGPYIGRRYMVAGTILSKRSDLQYERYTGAGAVTDASEVQTATVTGTPTGGTYTLAFDGQSTTAIAFNAASADVQTALRALTNIGATGVNVTGAAGGPYTITFAGTLANTQVSQITLGTNSLTGGTAPSVTTATTTQGATATAAQAIAGILFDTIEFADASNASDEPVAMLRRNVSFQSSKIIDYATYTSALGTALPTCEFI